MFNQIANIYLPPLDEAPLHYPSHLRDGDDHTSADLPTNPAADRNSDRDPFFRGSTEEFREETSRWSRNTSSLLLAEASTASGPARILRGVSQRLHRRTRSFFARPAAGISNRESRTRGNTDVGPGITEDLSRTNRRHSSGDLLARQPQEAPSQPTRAATVTATTNPINRRRLQREEQHVASRQDDPTEQDVPVDTPNKPRGLRRMKAAIARRTKAFLSKIEGT